MRLPVPVHRRLVLPVLAAAHVAVIAVAVAGGGTAAVARPPALATYDVAAPTLVALPALVAPREMPVAAEAAQPEIEFEGDNGAAGPCALSDQIGAALAADARAVAALAAMPRSARSVANAVLLWNGEWTTAERIGGEPIIAPLRAAVRERIAAASETCRAARISGPRLIYVNNDGVSLVLGFGSGDWAWSELLDA